MSGFGRPANCAAEAATPATWSTRLTGTAPLLAALLGLLIAVPDLMRPLPRAVTQVPDGVAALVDQHPILMSDYVAQVESETAAPFQQAAPATRAQVLHAMIDEELMVERGLALDLPENDTDVRQALVQGVGAQVVAPTLSTPIDDAALRAFYNAHRADYATSGTMRIRNLVLNIGGYRNADQTMAQATQDVAEAAYQLRAGAAVDAVMAHYGLVDAPEADSGRQFDFAAKLHLGDALYRIATTLLSGDVSDPVPQPDGVHLLIMQDRTPPHVTDFDHVRAAVYTAWRKTQDSRAQAANIGQLRHAAQIVLAPGMAE